MTNFSTDIDQVQEQLKTLEVKKSILLDKALTSDDPHEIIKAQGILSQIEAKQKSERKSMIIDPYEFSSSFGFKDKPVSMSYSMLSNMAKTPIINAIIRTRINQIAAFSEPQSNKYSTGYIIRKKRVFGVEGDDKLSKEEQKEIEELTEFIENCGNGFSFEGDQDFDTFIRKVVRDSLTYDQMSFEVVYDRKWQPYAFYSTDSSTMRIADSYDDDSYYGDSILLDGFNGKNKKREQIKGYYPSYVQIYRGQPVVDFYPWELCFGVRNPSTNLHMNGYGHSELEEMVSTVTSMLWGEEYNRRFFKQGSIPKGLLKVSGNIPEHKLNEFKQQWNATMRGVWNSWKTPVLESDKVEWVDLQKSNRDMEYSNWMEYMIKVACAVYSIDPSEVNFPLQGGAAQSNLFEGNPESRLKFSKDKGLYPILKFLQKKINRYLIRPKGDKYEFIFVGMDASNPKDEQDIDIKAVQNYMTVNEIRSKRGMEDIDGGDIILNSIYSQNQQMASMGEGEESQVDGFDESEFEEAENQENPIEKAFNNYINKINI